VTPLAVLGGVALVVFLADRVLLWMERRGWIDYRRTNPGHINPGQVGPAFLAIQGLLEPEKRHAAEEQTALRTSRDDRGGEPPDPLLDGDRERVVMEGDQRP
jgi:hypothetical protein